MSAPARPSEPGGFIAFPVLEAYGDGGFRFDGARTEGSVLVINGQVSSWPVTALKALEPEAFDPVFAADPAPEFILLGVGAVMAAPPKPVRERCREAAVGLEFMGTPAACRVYATMISEGRRIAAALIAVD